MEKIYENYQGGEMLAKQHYEILHSICQDDAFLSEVIHVYVCAAAGADTNPEITNIKL